MMRLIAAVLISAVSAAQARYRFLGMTAFLRSLTGGPLGSNSASPMRPKQWWQGDRTIYFGAGSTRFRVARGKLANATDRPVSRGYFRSVCSDVAVN